MCNLSRTIAGWLLPLAAASLASAQVKLPDGEGKELVQTVCAGCHGLETAIDTNRTEEEWRQVVDTMASRGAEATDEDFKKIVKYLAKYFGKAAPAPKSEAKPKEGAATSPSPTPRQPR